jgi:soluble lytic murein transglycosylase
MPATGRELARKLKVGGYSTARLKDPATNLRLGSYYLGQILAAFDGRVEPALASYNAGKSRADRWLTWAEYREPAEFIENIPFDQTREYVQVLLRNADVYRTLYEGVPITADPAPAIAKAPPAPKSTAKTTKTKPPAKSRAKR